MLTCQKFMSILIFLSVSGQTKNLNLTVVMATATLAILKWNKFEMDDSREMLGYVIYYREV